MNIKQETEEKIKIMQAFCNDIQIEFVPKQTCPPLQYERLHFPEWNWQDYDYRIKKTPIKKYLVLFFDIITKEYKISKEYYKSIGDCPFKQNAGIKPIELLKATEKDFYE